MSKDFTTVSNSNLQNQVISGFFNTELVRNPQLGGSIRNYTSNQKLTEAAIAIRMLLQQLEETYPTNTTPEKQVVIAEAIRYIESKPNLKAQVAEVLRTGDTEAFKQMVNYPFVGILMAALEGWQLD